MVPAPWPPLPMTTRDARLPLDARPLATGPWTDAVRTGLSVLDPLPAASHGTDGGPGGQQRSAAGPAGARRPPHIETVEDHRLAPEAYELVVDDEGVRIVASTATGALQACTTVRQLLPAQAWRSGAVRRDDWSLPQLRLADGPAHTYRGLMLDVARHFVPVPELLRWIELAAMHRLNHLHLHLTDDQGWRLPSAAFPALVEVASWRWATWVGHCKGIEPEDPTRLDGTPHGGSYSVADLREVGDHAARHGITLVPEVDLPGHACALLAAVPQLAVPGSPPEHVAQRWGLLGRTISPLPEALDVVATLLGEVADAIDSPYLHIGGDEADLTSWRRSPDVVAHARAHGGIESLRGLVNARLAGIALELGRRPMAWDDAFVAGGLPEQAVIMSWRSEQVGLRAARHGHDVVMTPVVPTYLDYAEDDGPDEPLSIGAPLTLQQAAAWAPPLAPGASGQVLGGQAQLWTEYLPTAELREYRAFPRLTVLAAGLWRGVPADHDRDADALADQLDRLSALHVNQRPATGPLPWQRAGTGARAPVGIWSMPTVVAHLAEAASRAEPSAL